MRTMLKSTAVVGLSLFVFSLLAACGGGGGGSSNGGRPSSPFKP